MSEFLAYPVTEANYNSISFITAGDVEKNAETYFRPSDMKKSLETQRMQIFQSRGETRRGNVRRGDVRNGVVCIDLWIR